MPNYAFLFSCLQIQLPLQLGTETFTCIMKNLKLTLNLLKLLFHTPNNEKSKKRKACDENGIKFTKANLFKFEKQQSYLIHDTTTINLFRTNFMNFYNQRIWTIFLATFQPCNMKILLYQPALELVSEPCLLVLFVGTSGLFSSSKINCGLSRSLPLKTGCI